MTSYKFNPMHNKKKKEFATEKLNTIVTIFLAQQPEYVRTIEGVGA